MEIKELKQQEFHEFSLSHPDATFYQSTAFTQIKEKEGWESYYIGGFVDGKLVAGSAIVCNPMFGKYLYCCAVKGFLMDYSDPVMVKEFTKGVVSFLKQRNGLYLRINPAFLYKEHDQNGDLVIDGFDHSDYVENLKSAGFVHEGLPYGFPENQHVRFTFVLPLEGENELTLKKNMSKLTQRNLKNIEKYHVVVKEIEKKEDLEIFIQIMNHTGNRRSFSIFTKEYYEEQFDVYYPNKMVKFLYAQFQAKEYVEDLEEQIKRSKKKLEQQECQLQKKGESEKLLSKMAKEKETLSILERKRKEMMTLIQEQGDVIPISAANFILYRDEITYFHGGSYDEYMHFCGQFALQWYMIQYGLKHRFKRYNFNGISGIFNDTAPDYGVYTFKKGFGGHVEEYSGYFHMPIRKYIYCLLQVAGKCKRIFKSRR